MVRPGMRKRFGSGRKTKRGLLEDRDRFEEDELPGRFEKVAFGSARKCHGNAEPKSLDGATFVPQEDGSLVTGKNPRDDRWVVKAEVRSGIRAIRIELDKSMKRKRTGAGKQREPCFERYPGLCQEDRRGGEGQAGQVDQPAGRSSAKYDQSFHRFLH